MNYKKKNIILVISSFVLMIVIYIFSISKTLIYKKKYNSLINEKNTIDSLSSKIRYLKKETIYLDSVFSNENISINNSFQQILLKKIDFFKKKHAIELINFKNSIQVLDKESNALLYPIILKGSFNSLLFFLNYIEQQGLGKIKSFKFLKKKNYRNNKEYLLLELYLEKIIE